MADEPEAQEPTTGETEVSGGRRGLFIVGGVIKQLITSADAHVIREHLSSLLQVHNLVVLLGSGASFHLGSPQTRNLTNQQVLDLITTARNEPTDDDSTLLSTINPTDNGDLEQLLNGLQLAATLATQAGQDSVTLGSGEFTRPFRKNVSRASAGRSTGHWPRPAACPPRERNWSLRSTPTRSEPTGSFCPAS
jgi:hypothetical protein